MGLFGSIKKAVSKTWSGVKGAVKKVASTVKKVSKKVAYAIPGGKQLWDLSSKVGKGVMKGIGKITSKLGPVGTIALSFVLAPVMGPMISSLWSGFGAGAAAMASSANVLVSSLGTAGSSIFAAGNWVGGTLGALGNAVTEGAGQIMNGNGFSAAAKSFATNMSNAFTGKAGMASVHAGAAQAAASASQAAAAGESWFAGAEQAAGLNADALGSLEKLGAIDPSRAGMLAKDLGVGLQNPASTVDLSLSENLYQAPDFNINNQADQALFGKPVNQMTLADQQAYTQFGGQGAVVGLNTPKAAPSSFSDNLSETASRASSASSLLGGGAQQQGGYSPYVPKAINSTSAKAGSVNGQGSSGFSLLGGVQGLEDSLRRSQQLMFG